MCNVEKIARHLDRGYQAKVRGNMFADVDELHFSYLACIPEARDWHRMGFVVSEENLIFDHKQFRSMASKGHEFG